MAKGGKAKKGVRKVSDDPIGDFLNDYEIEKLTKGMAELDAKIKDLEPVPTQVDTGSDPMLLDVYPRLKREMEANPHLYQYGTADKKDPSFRRPMLRKPAGRPDDVIPDRLDNDWLEYQLRPRGQTDFSDKLPPGIELPIGKVRSALEDPSEYYAKGGEVSGPKGFGLADVAPFVSPMSMKTGGSVMDKPQQDMRDPAYRRQLEREQALETSAPEFMLIGPAKAAGLAAKTMGRAATPAKSVTDNIQIGQYVKRNEKIANAIKEHMLDKAAPGERAAVAKKIEENLIKMRSQDRKARNFDELQNAVLNTEKNAIASVGAESIAEIAKRFKERNSQESSDNYKKGGLTHMSGGGQARTRAGTIAKPTFIDEQLGRTSERLSKLATDPGQAMRDIAAQYFPSPTESPEEQQRKLEELALGFTGSIKSVKGAPAVKAAKAPKIKQTVTDPQRIAFPGIYQRPDVIAAEAASRVAPESLNLKKIFGVTREDLFQMGKGREGNLPGELPGATANPRGSKAAAGVMNKKNEQRIIDAMAEAEKHPALVQGMDPWYVMDPVFQRMVKLLGKERAIIEYQRLNTLMGMASPGSEVLTEIPRGTAANMLYKQGRFPEFVEHLGKPASQRSTVPKDIVNVPGHMYHKTAQAIPMEQYLETGALQMDSPKVPMYIEASGVPETGFQTRTPVGDAHWSRAVGLADTRGARMLKGKPVIPGASVSTPEMQALAPWWQQNIAAPLGLESVPAQARAWGTFSGQTGVTTPIGAPKIELLADKIAETSRRLGISLEQARDRVLMGEAYAGKKKGGLAHI
jgi:hypothetical protein